MINLLIVPLIMGCALVGTVFLIKVIQKISSRNFKDKNKNVEQKENKNL